MRNRKRMTMPFIPADRAVSKSNGAAAGFLDIYAPAHPESYRHLAGGYDGGGYDISEADVQNPFYLSCLLSLKTRHRPAPVLSGKLRDGYAAAITGGKAVILASIFILQNSTHRLRISPPA